MTSSPRFEKQSLRSPTSSSGPGQKAELEYKKRASPLGSLRTFRRKAWTERNRWSAPIWNLVFFRIGADPTGTKWTLTLATGAVVLEGWEAVVGVVAGSAAAAPEEEASCGRSSSWDMRASVHLGTMDWSGRSSRWSSKGILEGGRFARPVSRFFLVM